MSPRTVLARILITGWILMPVAALAADRPRPLAEPPLGEQWFRIARGEERTGFARTDIAVAPHGYTVTADSSARMVVLGFSREAWSRETFVVGRDLAVKRFVVEQMIDGKKSIVQGELTPKGLRVKVERDGTLREKVLKPRGKLYPGPLLNVYPLIQPVVPGKSHRVQTIDPEEVKLKDVRIEVVGREVLPEGVETVHLRNDLYPFVANDIWVEPTGKTVRESVRDGLVETTAEPEAAARQFLLAAAIARQELVRPFTALPVDRAISRPAEVRQLTVDLSGKTERLPLFRDERQAGVRHDRGIVVTVRREAPAAETVPSGCAPAVTAVPEEELLALKNQVVGDATDQQAIVEKLALWTSTAIADSPSDHFSPVETARGKKGSITSRAALFAALANLAGVPARVVSGIAFLSGTGFAYHSWAESCAGGWRTVDPATGAVPVDATYVKLAEGTSPAALAPLAETVGNLRVKVVETEY